MKSSNASYTLIQIERDQPGIAILSLQRADKRNALNVELLRQLCHAIDELQQDAACRVLILRGDGPVFCAGMDLIEASQPATAEASAEGMRRVLELLCESPLIIIGAASGAAYAGGAGLLTACDLVVVSDDFKLGFPEVRRGLIAALVSGILAQRIRGSDLRELLLVAEPVSAEQALQMGLVHWIKPGDQLLEHAKAIAHSVLAGGPEAVRETKHLINRQSGAVDFGSLQALNERMRHGAEAREGLAAFREKRDPSWSGHS